MSVEDNDNYYVLPEEKSEFEDHSPLNYANIEESEEEPIEEGNKNIKTSSAFGLLLNIMFNPVEGWKKLRRSKMSVESLQSGCFYPVLAIMAVSRFAEYFYSVNISLSHLLTQAVVEFVAFFLGYFCVQMVLLWILPTNVAERFEERFGKEYTLIALSTLALFSIFTNILPMLWPILIFLPIWTLYIMFKGIRFFLFPEKQEMKFFVLSGTAVIGVPLLIEWALNSILPY